MRPDTGESRNRPVKHGPAPVEPRRKQGGILVFGRHDDALALESLEIPRRGQGNQRTAPGISRVHHGPQIQLVDSGDPGVLDTPDLFGMVFRIGRKGGPFIDPPVGHAVPAARRRKVR